MAVNSSCRDGHTCVRREINGAHMCHCINSLSGQLNTAPIFYCVQYTSLADLIISNDDLRRHRDDDIHFEVSYRTRDSDTTLIRVETGASRAHPPGVLRRMVSRLNDVSQGAYRTSALNITPIPICSSSNPQFN